MPEMEYIRMLSNDVRYTCCPACNADGILKVGDISYNSRILFSTSQIELEFTPELWRCSNCGSFFVQNRVPEAMAISLYSQGVSAERWSHIPFHINKPSNQLNCLKNYFINGRKLLDIGCNTGELLDYAKTLGCETSGIEYSKSSRTIIQDKGHNFFSSLSDVDHKFDVITAFDLVEHLYDIPIFFSNCRNMLNKNGVLIVLTGNIESISAKICKSNWWYLQYPEHIVFLSRKYFIQFSGFLVEKWVKTYASKGYQCSSPQLFRGLASGFLQKNYNGLPSLGPDHVLAVLKKC